MNLSFKKFEATKKAITTVVENVGSKTDDIILNIKGVSESRLEDKHVILARISRDVYQQPYSRISFNGYKYSPLHSTVNYGVYINEELKQIVIGIKGTTSTSDLFKDINLTLGLLPTSLFKNTLNNIKKLINTLPSYKVILTGHSLGGTKVLYVSEHLKLKGVVFNAFIPRLDTTGIQLIEKSKRVIKYTTIGDILSNSILGVKSERKNIRVVKTPKVGLLNKHAISSYL